MKLNLENLSFDEKGLIPAIVQDIQSSEVLMLAYMNEEALTKTVETKRTWFYSRSRNALWNKGETSGNIQIVKKLSYDCDGDAILVQVEQTGNACHTGEKSCFFNEVFVEKTTEVSSNSIMQEIYHLVKERKEKPEEGSYTNYLFQEGLDKILKKIGEEASEVIIGAKNEDKQEVIYELSDFIYHAIVLMVYQGVTIEDIRNELKKRFQK